MLNASFEPLQIVSWQRAIQLLFQGKVEVVEESDREVRTVRMTIRVPAVLRLLQYVPLTQKKQVIRFSRTNVFLRDEHKCQYCGNRFPKNALTIDHVVPVVQKGDKSWENIVTACKPCNQRKGGRTPAQANMKLIRKPKRPHWLPSNPSLRLGSVEVGTNSTPGRWQIYLKLDRNYSPDLDPEDDPT